MKGDIVTLTIMTLEQMGRESARSMGILYL